MKNFDELLEPNRTFVIGGETFRWKNQRPEGLSLFARLESEKPELDPEADVETTTNAGWKRLDEQVLLFLEDGERERWVALREREENPVTVWQLHEVVAWLVEQQTNRPTETLSPSAPGRGRTVATSKGQ